MSKVNIDHLKVYYDVEWARRDGKGFCVDEDHADDTGDTGYRFVTAKGAADMVVLWLRQSFMATKQEKPKKSKEPRRKVRR